jgi:hypothetical protein
VTEGTHSREDAGSSARTEAQTASVANLLLRHFRLGWSMLALFVAWGLVLDAMHAFKIGLYLDVDAETRRFMWSLAHAHGLGLGLLHLGFGATLHAGLLQPRRTLEHGSTLLVWGSILIPFGFVLGGLVTRRGDPSLGVFIVPVGGVLLAAGIVLVMRELLRRRPDGTPLQQRSLG